MICCMEGIDTTQLYTDVAKAIVNRFYVPSFSKQLMPMSFILQVNEGTNITADSFYSSQGRADPSFRDENLSSICCPYVSSSAGKETPITFHYLLFDLYDVSFFTWLGELLIFVWSVGSCYDGGC